MLTNKLIVILTLQFRKCVNCILENSPHSHLWGERKEKCWLFWVLPRQFCIKNGNLRKVILYQHLLEIKSIKSSLWKYISNSCVILTQCDSIQYYVIFSISWLFPFCTPCFFSFTYNICLLGWFFFLKFLKIS